jgi:transposase
MAGSSRFSVGIEGFAPLAHGPDHGDAAACGCDGGLRVVFHFVEGSFAWLGRCRRLAKDWERSIESSTAWACVASIRLITRRLAS